MDWFRPITQQASVSVGTNSFVRFFDRQHKFDFELVFRQEGYVMSKNIQSNSSEVNMAQQEELIHVTQAAKLLPSHKPGRRVHVHTIYRWIREGKLPAVKRGRFFFVRRCDILAMAKPVAPPSVCRGPTPRTPAWVHEQLKRSRII